MNKFGMFLIAIALAVMAPVAQGALQLSFDVIGDVPGPAVCASDAGGLFANCPAGTGGNGVTINGFTGDANPPGGINGSFEFGSTVRVTNSTTEQRTVIFWIAAQGFTSPTTPPSLTFTSNSAGTGVLGSTSLSLVSCVDIDNELTPPNGTFCSGNPGNIGLANPPISMVGAGGQDSDTVSTTVNNLTVTPFALTQQITLILQANSAVNFNTSAILTQVPEPTSIALLGGVLLLTGVGLRRKFAQR